MTLSSCPTATTGRALSHLTAHLQVQSILQCRRPFVIGNPPTTQNPLPAFPAFSDDKIPHRPFLDIHCLDLHRRRRPIPIQRRGVLELRLGFGAGLGLHLLLPFLLRFRLHITPLAFRPAPLSRQVDVLALKPCLGVRFGRVLQLRLLRRYEHVLRRRAW